MTVYRHKEESPRIMSSGDASSPHGDVELEMKSFNDISTGKGSFMIDKEVQCGSWSQDEGIHCDTSSQNGRSDCSAFTEGSSQYRDSTQPIDILSFNDKASTSTLSQVDKRLMELENIEAIEENPLPETAEEKLSSSPSDKLLSNDVSEVDGPRRADASSEPDDDCMAQCLYYTVQCCECVIL